MAPFIRAVLALAILAAAPPRLAAAAEFVDPNAQTEGVGASLNGAKLGQSNPLNLTAATVIGDQKDPPNAGFTLISPVGTDSKIFDPEMWSYEYDGYNMEVVGETVMVNIKDPKWPVLWTIFDWNPSDTQFAPIVIDLVNITMLDEIAQGLTDGEGNPLGYFDFLDAANQSAIGILTRMAEDPTQAIFGVMGNEYTTADDLVGGINEPVNDDTFIPLTEEELANLPDADALKEEYTGEGFTGSESDSASASSTPEPATPSEPASSPPPSAGTTVQAGLAALGSVLVGLLLLS